MTYDVPLRQDTILRATTLDLGRMVTRHSGHRHEAIVADPIDRIQSALVTVFGIGRQEMLSRCRTEHLVWPRQIGMALAYDTGGFGLVHVGKCFGGRSAATVINAMRQVNARCDTDKKSKEQVERVKGLLR